MTSRRTRSPSSAGPSAPATSAAPQLPAALRLGALALGTVAGAALLAAAPLITRPLAAQAAPQPGGGRVVLTVIDSGTGRPLVGVQVSIVGTRLGGITDEQGRASIGAVPAGTYAVEARRIGYAPGVRRGVVVSAGGTTEANLMLAAAVLNLQAVVTTGVVDPTSGTRVPFTVGRVSAEQVPVPPTNAVETLAGRVAGASVVSTGQPGSGVNIQLRTPASITKGNEPLIVVDGVILAQSVDASTADLNSLDIENVEVVKGAAAASLYGSRASNGVIQITTRRGKELTEGPTRVTLRTELGQNGLQRPLEFSQYNAYLVQNGEYVNASGAPVSRDQRVTRAAANQPLYQDQIFPGATFDPIEQFFDAGRFAQTNVSVSQNAGRTNFLLNMSNQKADGVILDAGGYTRNDARLNLDHRLRDDLTIGVSGYYAASRRSDLDEDLFFDLVNQAPDIDLGIRTETGEYVFQPDPVAARANPLYTLETQDRGTKRTRFLGSAQARYAPLGWLTFDANLSYDRADRSSDYFLDRGHRTLTQTFDRLGAIELLDAQTTAMNGAATMNLLGRFGDLTARGALRGQMERESGTRLGYRGTDLLVPGVRNINNVRSRLPVSDGEDGFLDGDQNVEIRTNSYVGSLGFDWAGRYIVDGLVRRDGSSLFGPDERWQTYYRISGAWRMGQESWFPFKGTITEFKPRVSQGTSGGRPDFSDQYETYDIDNTGNLVKATLGNSKLRPELAKETEAGLDMIIRNRYSVQVSYSRSTVTDQLLPLPLPAPAGGFAEQWQNAGTLKGNTFEATFEAKMIERPSLGWTLGLVADRTRNKITEFNRSCYVTGTIGYRCAGVTVGTMYGARFARTAEELVGVPDGQLSEFQVNDDGLLVWTGPGRDFRAQAWDASGTIAGRTYNFGRPVVVRDSAGTDVQGVIGDGNPSFRWGVSNNVRWRGFSFFALVDAQVGGDVYNRTKQRMYQYYRSADVDQAGKPDDLKKPQQYYDALYNANNVNQWFVEKGSYVKLREASVTYRLGGSALAAVNRVGARGVTLGLIGRNLFTSTDYSGYDPEVGSVNRRIDDFVYPRFRTFTGSVQVEF